MRFDEYSSSDSRESRSTMTVLTLLLVALSIWGVIATVIAVKADGYHAIPTRRF